MYLRSVLLKWYLLSELSCISNHNKTLKGKISLIAIYVNSEGIERDGVGGDRIRCDLFKAHTL